MPTVDTAGTYVLTVTGQTTQCTETFSVTVTEDITDPSLTPAPDTSLTCRDATIVLNGGQTPAADRTYNWTALSGTFDGRTDTLSPTLSTAGTYVLTVRDVDNGCTSTDTVTVVDDNTDPMALAGPDATLTCRDSSFQLGTGSPIAGIDYVWTSTDGTLAGPVDAPVTTTENRGTYVLTATNPANGCAATDTVVIDLDRATPVAGVNAPADLTCADPTVQLLGTNSGSADNLVVNWSPAGGLTGPTDQLAATANRGGTYLLTLTNAGNACFDTVSVTVTDNQTRPAIAVNDPAAIDCRDPQSLLDGTGSASGADIEYTWRDLGGTTVGTTVMTNVTAPGSYVLTVRDVTSDCQATDTVVVDDIRDLPAVNLGPAPLTVTCDRPSVELMTGGSGAPGLTYTWTFDDGSGPAPAGSTEDITVMNAGTYAVNVVNPANGCENDGSITVVVDTAAPVLTLPGVADLTCANPARLLTGGVTSDPAALSFAYLFNGDTVATGAGPLTIAEPGAYTFAGLDADNGCRATVTTTVGIDTLSPEAEAGPDLVLNCYVGMAQLRGEEGSGVPVTYAWSTLNGNITNTTGNLAMIDAMGTYELLVRSDANGCTDTDTVVVTEDFAEPLFTLPDPQDLTCTTTQRALNAGAEVEPGRSYGWTGLGVADPRDGDGPVVTVTEPGRYVLTIQDTGNGCTATDTVTLGVDTVAPVVAIAPAADLTCTQTSLFLDATASSADGDFLREWTLAGTAVPSGGLRANVSDPGTYQLRLTDPTNGCRDSATVTVAIDTVSPVARVFTDNTLDCVTPSITLDGTASTINGAGTRYAWTTADGAIDGDGTQPTVDVTAGGTYQLLLSQDRNGCRDSVTITVEQDTVAPVLGDFTPDVLTCVTERTTLTVPVIGSDGLERFNWTTSNGNIIRSTPGGSALVDAPGTYRVVVRNGGNSCTTERIVTVMEDVALPDLALRQDYDLGCDTMPYRLALNVGGGGTFTYAWTAADGGLLIDNVTSASPLVRNAGRFTVLVTSDRNGCAATDSVRTEQDLPVSFDFTVRQPTCRDSLGQVDFAGVTGGIGPYLFSIDGGDSFRPDTAFATLDPSNYELVIQDVNGCELREDVTLVPPRELDIRLPDVTVVDLGEPFFLNTQTNFADEELTLLTWSDTTDLSCGTCLRPTAVLTASRNYVLRAESFDGCVATASINLVLNRARNVYFPSAFSPNGDGTNDRFFPQANNRQVTEVRNFGVYDRWGNEVYFAEAITPNTPSMGWDGSARGQLLNGGVFVWKAEVVFLDGGVIPLSGEVMLVR